MNCKQDDLWPPERCNDPEYGTGHRVASRLEWGGVVINSSGNYRHLDQPFGGWKKSGIGREGVSVTLDEMTQAKFYILKNVLA